jgi:hypothetical protein
VQYQGYFYYGSIGSSLITADIIVPKRTPLSSNMFSYYNNGENKHIYVPDDAVDAYKTKYSSVQNIHPFSDAPASLMAKLKVPIGD